MLSEEDFKYKYFQQPITFLTEENLDKLETHCRKAIRYERGVEHRVVLELLERYEEFLAEREQDKKRIKELEETNKKYIVQLTDEQYRNLVDIIRKEVKQEFEQKVKEELERAEKENKPYEEYEIESRMYWINQGKISLAKKLLENKMLKEKELEYSDFNTYPHYVFATAFLVNGELADYKIQNRERNWENRTFRGSDWENEVWEKGFITKELDLTCEYKKILVNNSEEHNEAFEKLEDWLFTNFKIYQKANPVRW